MALFSKYDLINKSYNQINKSFSSNNEQYEAKKLLEHASKSFSEYRDYDIFLSHSSLDARAVLGLKLHLEEMGCSVYVDWIEDRQLDRSKVNRQTADLLRKRMMRCTSLFYATSDNSEKSRWMPWELGYFDGIKGKVAILPILNNSTDNRYNGQEYLGLYPYVTKSNSELFIHNSTYEYQSLSRWLLDSFSKRYSE